MIHNAWPSEAIKVIYASICHLGPVGNIQNLPRKVTIVEVDEKGNILRSFQNTNDVVSYFYQLLPVNQLIIKDLNHLYIIV